MKGTPKYLITKLLELPQDKIYELKEHQQKRTLTQNSYYWELLNQLARVMRIPSQELHFELIKRSSPFEEYLVLEEASLRHFDYCEVYGKIKKNDKTYNIVRAYLGSSRLDTKEFGILLDNLIEECKLQNIDTLTPEERAKLK